MTELFFVILIVLFIWACKGPSEKKGDAISLKENPKVVYYSSDPLYNEMLQLSEVLMTCGNHHERTLLLVELIKRTRPQDQPMKNNVLDENSMNTAIDIMERIAQVLEHHRGEPIVVERQQPSRRYLM